MINQVSQSLRCFRPHPVSNHLTTDNARWRGCRAAWSHVAWTTRPALLYEVDSLQLGLLATVALTAGLIPAQRASCADPMVALREQ